MITKFDINLNEGLGDIKFGMSKEKVIEVFGTPEDEEIIDENDVFFTDIFHYLDDTINLFFEYQFSSVLSNIEVSHPDSSLFGQKVFELSEDEIIELMKNNDFIVMEKENEPWGEKRVTFDNGLVDFYFEKEKLVSISWGVADI